MNSNLPLMFGLDGEVLLDEVMFGAFLLLQIQNEITLHYVNTLQLCTQGSSVSLSFNSLCKLQNINSFQVLKCVRFIINGIQTYAHIPHAHMCEHVD